MPAARRLVPLIVAILLGTTGCMSNTLRRHTNQTIDIVTEIQYKQVLNNLAMTVNDPSVLPSFAVVTSGVVQANHEGQVGYAFSSNPLGFAGLTNNNSISLSSSRTTSGQWSLVPTTDPCKLERMKHAYQLILGYRDPDDDSFAELAEFFEAEFPKAIPVGWFHVGTNHDLPRQAVIWGRYRDIYVWVMPEGLPSLARFTLSILDIATVESHVPTVKVTRIYNGPPIGPPDKIVVGSQDDLPIKNQIDPFRPRERYHHGRVDRKRY